MKKNNLVLVTLMLLGLVLGANSAEAFFGFNKKDKKMESEKTNEVLAKEDKKTDTVVVMETEQGVIEIKLYEKESPITAGNFKKLVEEGFYNGLTFHRVIPGFMIQGGDPNGDGTGGSKENIPFEFNDLTHDKPGVVAMARTMDPNSASSQFFIDLGPQPHLNNRKQGDQTIPGYAIFGQVIKGMEAVTEIVGASVPASPGSDRPANPQKIIKAFIKK